MGNEPLVSCCMIVRDEAHNLPECFASASGLVDEWVVLDTGSTDGTPGVAAELGATVLQDPWRDDFAHSRNLSLAAATGEWILILDGDDRLQDAPRLRRHLESGPPEDALFLQVRSRVVSDAGAETWESFWQPRLLRRSAGIRYRYPMHAVPVLDDRPRGPAPGCIDHRGYVTPEARRAKAARTLRILQSLPEDDPHRAYQQLRAHAMLGDFAAIEADAEHLQRVLPAMPPDAWALWSHALLRRGRPVEAAERVLQGLRLHPQHPDLFHALFSAAGVGFVGAARDIQKRGGLYDGLTLSLGRVPDTVRALVDLQILQPEVLQTSLLQFGRDGFARPAGSPAAEAAPTPERP